MRQALYFISLSFILTNCGLASNDSVGICCDKTYTNVDSAINCFDRTANETGTSPDHRLLLIAFVKKDVEANQKLGWGIINDPDIVIKAKRYYALIILDANQYGILNEECSYNIPDILQEHLDKTVFIITNPALCSFGNWTLDDDKESIIERLGVGDGP